MFYSILLRWLRYAYVLDNGSSRYAHSNPDRISHCDVHANCYSYSYCYCYCYCHSYSNGHSDSHGNGNART